MDTVIPNQSVPEEHVSIAEDAKQTTVEQPAAESPAQAAATVPESARPAEPAAAEQPAPQEEKAEEVKVDFSDEEAQLASENAGIDLGEATPEEEEAEESKAADPKAAADDTPDLTGKSKPELVEIFAQLLETKPIQSLRAQAEAIKVAFYKLRRAEIEAQRKEFVEAARRRISFRPWTATKQTSRSSSSATAGSVTSSWQISNVPRRRTSR